MKRSTYSTYEAKARFSEILRQVRRGETVFITSRGREVAELRPLEREENDERKLERLERAGVLSPERESRISSENSLRPLAKRPGALDRFLESRE